MRNDDGFTLIELLVVILIIAILAAVAIPLFLRQREKAYQADITAALREGATAAEAWATGHQGSFDDLDGDDGSLLEIEGFKASAAVSVVVAATESDYCITATHSMLSAAPEHAWRVATYDSDIGKPTDANACTP